MRLHPEQQYQQQPVTDGNQASQWQEAGAAPALENIRLYRMKKSFMRGLHFVLSPPKDTDSFKTHNHKNEENKCNKTQSMY